MLNDVDDIVFSGDFVNQDTAEIISSRLSIGEFVPNLTSSPAKKRRLSTSFLAYDHMDKDEENGRNSTIHCEDVSRTREVEDDENGRDTIHYKDVSNFKTGHSEDLEPVADEAKSTSTIHFEDISASLHELARSKVVQDNSALTIHNEDISRSKDGNSTVHFEDVSDELASSKDDTHNEQHNERDRSLEAWLKSDDMKDDTHNEQHNERDRSLEAWLKSDDMKDDTHNEQHNERDRSLEAWLKSDDMKMSDYRPMKPSAENEPPSKGTHWPLMTIAATSNACSESLDRAEVITLPESMVPIWKKLDAPMPPMTIGSQARNAVPRQCHETVAEVHAHETDAHTSDQECTETVENCSEDEADHETDTETSQDESFEEGVNQFSAITPGDFVGVFVRDYWKGRPQIGKVVSIDLKEETVLLHWFGASWSGKCTPLYDGGVAHRKPKTQLLDIRCILLWQFCLTRKKRGSEI